jgi:hypothetical protein
MFSYFSGQCKFLTILTMMPAPSSPRNYHLKIKYPFLGHNHITIEPAGMAKIIQAQTPGQEI